MPGHLAPRDPSVKELAWISLNFGIRPSDRLIREARFAECCQHLLREARAVIVERHAGVATIAGNVDVFDVVIEW